MADGTSADVRLQRILYVIPAASRKGGVSYDELARTLGTTRERIVADLEEVTDRAFYHPGGWPDDVSILLGPDRVEVLHASGLQRPGRLSTREALCLALGLRGSAASARLPADHARAALLRRVEEHLVALDHGTADEVLLASGDTLPDPAGVRETLMAASRDRRPCAIVYAKPSADELDARVIHPYTLAHGEGVWYVVGWCAVKEGMRVFRVDRILEAAPTDGSFEVPDDFDPASFIDAARVYRAEADMEVRVRYSPRVARWVRERAGWGMSGWEEEADGSVVVRHRVADPHWVVGHALNYGAEAEILEPEEVRALVREVVEELAG